MNVYSNILDMVGKTPMLEVSRLDTGPCRLFLKLELANPGGALLNGVGIPRQTIGWNTMTLGTDAVASGTVATLDWQEIRGWFRPNINGANPGGTAGDNTWPWDGSDPPGSVWALSGSPYDKHNRMLLHTDDCASKYGALPPPGTGPAVAIIDETLCIGCTHCIGACPVDAIVGAQQLMHTVIESECTGCELCVAPCPVDCISMRSVS